MPPMKINYYLNYLNEGYIFDDKTISIDLDRFESGESNVLLITGSPGSGKTTLAKYLNNNYKVKVIHLDEYIKESKELISWLKKNNLPNIDEYKKLPQKQKLDIQERVFNEVGKPLVLEFFKQGIKQRCIVEGTIIAEGFNMYKPYIIKEKMPMIIIGKSGLKSTLSVGRRSKIKHPDIKISSTIQTLWKHFKLNMTEWVKALNNTRKERSKVPNSKVEIFVIPDLK